MASGQLSATHLVSLTVGHVHAVIRWRHADLVQERALHRAAITTGIRAGIGAGFRAGIRTTEDAEENCRKMMKINIFPKIVTFQEKDEWKDLTLSF